MSLSTEKNPECRPGGACEFQENLGALRQVDFFSSLPMEALKVLSGKWRPVAAPRYWCINRDRIRIQRINGPSVQTLLVWQRRIMYRIFQTPLGVIQSLFQWLWWPWFNRHHKRRQKG